MSNTAMMSVLAVDAMYFHAAQESLSRAKQCESKIDEARKDIAALQRKIDKLTHSREGKKDAALEFRNYPELEPLYIQIEGAEYRLGEAYGPMLQDLATVHILCAAAAEAHINIQAQARLQGRDWTGFERLPVDVKWCFLPKLMSLPGFDPGKQPLQGFDQLLRWRNKLIHYRFQKEPWDSPGVPEFLISLGLTIDSGELSLTGVKGMVVELARQLKQDPPYWVTGTLKNFFEVIFGDAKK